MRPQVESGISITTARPSGFNLTPVHLQIDNYALSHPDRAAIVDGNGAILTYKNLSQKARILSAHLSRNGIRKGSVVALRVAPGPNMIIGMLGIFGTGATMLPLTLDQPTELVSFMLNDSGADLILGDTADSIVQSEKYLHLFFDNLYSTSIDGVRPISDKFAYIIYTSGSTGKPKGVKVRHTALANLCSWYQNFCFLSEASKTLVMIPITSDAVYKNIFATLSSGGTLVLPALSYYHPLSLLRRIASEQVTHINCVPGAIYQILFLAKRNNYVGLRTLQALILGGEAMNKSNLQDWFFHDNNHSKLFNVYGPTECTDIAIATVVTKDDFQSTESIPLGHPITNVQIYIIGADGNQVAENDSGELWISGMGVTGAYLNNPELNTDRFMKDPFSENELVYKTGDLAMKRKDGKYRFLGRIDQQVKIKGFRVEPAEISARINELPDVLESVIIPIKNNQEVIELRGYVVMQEGKSFDMTICQNHLRKYLRAFMIPKSIQQIPEIPRSANGKIDYKFLKASFST